jgi:hypothetical protein|tara:strand:+ start:2418 stop:3014 length:597 start_codon:yes stop_codon:yes gene_type:complete
MATSETAINFLQRNMDIGRPIPGQSLTNDPNNPYPWEQPPEFTDPQRAMLQIFETLTEKDTLSNTLLALVKGVSVIDISSIVLYTGFLEGKWNPDVMTLLMEPTMYMIMYLGDQAGINYNMDSKKENNKDEPEGEQQVESLNKSLNELKQIAADRVSPMSVSDEITKNLEAIKIPQSLLSKVEEEQKNSNMSLLSREK